MTSSAGFSAWPTHGRGWCRKRFRLRLVASASRTNVIPDRCSILSLHARPVHRPPCLNIATIEWSCTGPRDRAEFRWRADLRVRRDRLGRPAPVEAELNPPRGQQRSMTWPRIFAATSTPANTRGTLTAGRACQLPPRRSSCRRRGQTRRRWIRKRPSSRRPRAVTCCGGSRWRRGRASTWSTIATTRWAPSGGTSTGGRGSAPSHCAHGSTPRPGSPGGSHSVVLLRGRQD
jgi:hypothetical protein